MPRPHIYFHVPHTPAKGLEYIQDALARNEHVNGTYSRRSAEFLEHHYGVDRVLPTHSATAGLEMAAMLMKSVRGAARAYMPSFTFSSTANAFLRAGFELTFVDIDPQGMAAGVDEFAAADPPPGSVIVAVHYGGDLGEIDRLSAWTEERGVYLVEDAAQALGSRSGSRFAGTIGELGIISFHYTKNVHASMGGALFINAPDLIETATYVWERGTNRQAFLRGAVDRYTWVEVGSSFQGSELQAALLLAGLEEFGAITEHRRSIWQIYFETLNGREPDLFAPPAFSERANAHMFFVRLPSPELAEALRVHMKEWGADLYSHYVPLHNSPLGVRLGLDAPLPQTERWAESVLRLPLHTHLGADDAQRVADEIVDWLARHHG